jgi:hypothetical protein
MINSDGSAYNYNIYYKRCNLLTTKRTSSWLGTPLIDISKLLVPLFLLVEPLTQWSQVNPQLRPGCSEMTSVHPMVLRDMKSRLTQSVCTTVTLTGLQKSPGTLITLKRNFSFMLQLLL